MLIYNSLTEKKEVVKKPWFRTLKFFVCGPTVYDSPHIGNLRTFMSFDIIVRYMRSRGFKISYLQNITDVDDKIIARAIEENVPWNVIAQRYEKEFLEYVKILNISSVDRYARATDHISDIIRQVTTLIKKEYAYKIEKDGWYFDLSRFTDYGKLAHRTVTQAEDGVSRIDVSAKKRNTGDFCLWKFSPPTDEKDEPSWRAPFGDGRPGWHIEDTAITESFFGPQYDIHGGGLDLKFPHHEAEIAQQESASGKKPFVRIWMHSGFLQVQGKKMSKSLGNFVSIQDLLKKMTPDDFRFMMLQHHYRAPFSFSDDAIAFARTNFEQIRDFIALLTFVETKGKENKRELAYDTKEKFEKEFHSAMNDDINTPEALGSLRMFMNEIYPYIFDLAPSSAKTARTTVVQTLSMLGFMDIEPIIPENVLHLANERELYRGNKQFTHADALREKMNALGYTVEDTPLGPLIKKFLK